MGRAGPAWRGCKCKCGFDFFVAWRGVFSVLGCGVEEYADTDSQTGRLEAGCGWQGEATAWLKVTVCADTGDRYTVQVSFFLRLTAVHGFESQYGACVCLRCRDPAAETPRA